MRHIFVLSGDNVLKGEELDCAIRLSLDCRFAVGVAPSDDSPERAFVWVQGAGETGLPAVARLVERPSRADGGLIKLGFYSFKRPVYRRALEAVGGNTCGEITMTDVMLMAMAQGIEISALPFSGFFDVGTESGYKACRSELSVSESWWY
ncbi:sugar phosphate nucleotidyltransferase [Cutibacterium sp. V947]|uniref:sugar phosphate nucleotidyltransferase n=1 Tax=unclassified Cutibacterium TaxID=2649671 RepID=UPI003EE36C61